MSKWPKLRSLADRLYDIAEDGAQEKTASEVESEMEVYLLGELRPLLQAVEDATEINSGTTRFNLSQELEKFKK